MPIRLTEHRAPRSGSSTLDTDRVAELVRLVTAGLGDLRVDMIRVEAGLKLDVEFEPRSTPDAIRQAFAVALATFRVAADDWGTVAGPKLAVDEPRARDRIDRLGLPLSLYGAPNEEGSIECHSDGLVIALPEGSPAQLGRLAAIMVAVLRADGTRVAPRGLTRAEHEWRWRGLGSAGRAARVDSGAPAQRCVLTLLGELESGSELALDDAWRDLLREELTGALPLPIDGLEASTNPLSCPGVVQARCPVPEASVILAAHGEGHKVLLTVEALRSATSESYEVVVVDDGSRDGCCEFLREHPDDYPEVTLVTQEQQGSAQARNSGVVHARAPTVVFMDAHCFPHEGWLGKLLRVLDDAAVGIATPAISVAGDPGNKGYGLTIGGPRLLARWLERRGETPYRVPAAGAGCLAMRRATFDAIGGFEPMRRYGLEDVELSIRCWLAGFEVVVEPRADVGHWFKKEPNFEIPWTDTLYNVLRTAILHFDGKPLRAVVDGASGDPCFGAAMGLLLTSDIWTRRAAVRARAVRDGDWYCKRFGVQL